MAGDIKENNAVTDCNAALLAKARVDFKHISGGAVNAERAVGIGLRAFDNADYSPGTVDENHIKGYGGIAHRKSMFLFLVK